VISWFLKVCFFKCCNVCHYASERAVQLVGIKAELQTERQRLVLFDNTAAPIPVLQPGEAHDFTVEHDLKELGAHTLVCSTVYTDAEGERRYLPQYFKFSASNPLAVRTKVGLYKL
jgi:hypothetical protein